LGAAALSGTLRTLLVGVSATDPLTFAGTSALFLAMTMVACWIPARRAVALDPNIALREE
jgi:ABC-type antimicrobial peptide transport system permease subunit